MAYGRVLIMQSLIKVAIPSQAGTLTYDGNSKTPTWNNYNPAVMTIGGVYQNKIDAGTYYAEFSLAIGYCWEDGDTGTKTVAWNINQQKLDVPAVSDTTQTYDGTTKNPTIATYDKNLISVIGSSGVDVNEYTLTFSLKDKKNYCWSDGTTADKTSKWNIVAQALSNELSTFSQSGALVFDSTTQTVTIAGYDERYHILGGVTSGFDAKTYTATISPKSGYTFANGSTAPITVQWKIDVRVLTKPVASQTAFDYGKTYNIADYISNYDAKYMTIGGTTAPQSEPNSYTTTFTLKSTTNTKWSDNSTAAVSITWEIGAMRIPKPTLKSDVPLVDGVASYPYTGSTIELGVDNFNSAYMTRANYSGSAVKSYTATYTLSNTNKAVWDDGSTDPVTISWAIYKKNSLAVPTVTGKNYTGSTINATISTYDTTLIEIVADSSVTSATDAGEYQVVFRLKRPQYDTWSDHSTIDKVVKWYIKRQFEVPTLSNKPYTGNLITQEYSSEYITMSGETSGTAAKTYTAIFSLNDTTLYEWSDGTTAPKSVEWTIEIPRLISLLHFDDENDIYRDECGIEWTITLPNKIKSVEARFGRGISGDVNAGIGIYHIDNKQSPIYLGGKDFTIDFWAYSYINTYSNITIYFYSCQNNTAIFNGSLSKQTLGVGGVVLTSKYYPNISDTQLKVETEKWYHIAIVYEHDNSLLRLFINGEYCGNKKFSVSRENYYFNITTWQGTIFDEFRVVDGIAQWTEDFTPPTEPYRVEDYSVT